MRYLATDVRIYTGTNSRGDYNWMSMRLFNDATPQANPTRLPTYYVMLPIIVNAFLACKDALSVNAGGWIDVNMEKVPDEGLTQHHLNLIRPEVVTLDGWYQQLYTRDYTDSNGILHPKGSVRTGNNDQPLAPVNALRVYVQYAIDQDFGDKYPIETKEEIARGILERGYRKLTAQTVTEANGEEPEPEPEQSTADSQAELRAKLGIK